MFRPDMRTPYEDGTSTTAMAATTGHAELIEFLVSRGAPEPDLSPQDAFTAAVLAVDRGGVERLRREHPGLAEDVRAARPGLVVWAAATGSAGAVELLVGLGFDVSAMGRADVPRFGATPLGWAHYFDRQPIIDLLEPVTAPEAAPESGHG